MQTAPEAESGQGVNCLSLQQVFCEIAKMFKKIHYHKT